MSIRTGGHAEEAERGSRGWQFLSPGLFSNSAPPSVGADRLIVGQEWPDYPRHPLPRFWIGIQGPNIAAPPQVRDSILLRQEMPDHPGSRFAAGVQGPNVSPPQLTQAKIANIQELPWHPDSRFWTGVQGPNVGIVPQIIPKIITVQEWPWHPRSFLWTAPPPVPAFRGQGNLVTRQHWPWHPSSIVFAGTPPHAYEEREFFVII